MRSSDDVIAFVGRWCDRQRTAYKSSKLTASKIAELEDAGFEWDPLDASWNRHIAALKEYKSENNGRDPPQSYQVSGPIGPGGGQMLQLGFWCFNRKQARKHGKLNQDKMQELDELGFDWVSV